METKKSFESTYNNFLLTQTSVNKIIDHLKRYGLMTKLIDNKVSKYFVIEDSNLPMEYGDWLIIEKTKMEENNNLKIIFNFFIVKNEDIEKYQN